MWKLDYKTAEKVKVKLFSHVQLFGTPWTIAYQASLSIGFSRQEYRSGLPFPSPGDLPNPGIKLMSLTAPHWQVGSLALAPPGKPKRSDFFQAPVALDLPVGWECVEQSTKQYLTLSSSTQLFCAPCHSNSTILFMTSHWNDFCMYVFSLDWKLW